jgi:hypothetical protein
MTTKGYGRPLTADEQRAAEDAIRRAPKNVWLITGRPLFPTRRDPSLRLIQGGRP